MPPNNSHPAPFPLPLCEFAVLAPTKPLPAISSLTSKTRPAPSHNQQQEQAAEETTSVSEQQADSTTTTLRSAASPSSETQPPLASESTSLSETNSESSELQAVDEESIEQAAADEEEEYEYVEEEEEEEEFESMGVDLEDERSLEQVQADELEQELSPRVSADLARERQVHSKMIKTLQLLVGGKTSQGHGGALMQGVLGSSSRNLSAIFNPDPGP